MRFFLASALLICLGCAHTEPATVRPSESSLVEDKNRELSEIINAEKVLALGRFDEARILFKDFQIHYPRSVYFESARLGEAQAFEGMGYPQEAVQLYRNIFFKTEKDQTTIAGLALYRMSFAFEAQGDDLKAVAALLDAKRKGSSLPSEVLQAQIPARLAMLYARQNREVEAMAYLNEAEKGIAKVIIEKGRGAAVDWLAKIYFEMGSVSTNQLTLATMEDFVRAQKVVQIYLIKSLKQDDPVWSARSLKQLQEIYRALLQQVELAPNNSKVLSITGGSFLELLDQADLFRPLADQRVNSYEKDFYYSFLPEIRKKAELIIFGTPESLTLTEESQKLNSLKRSGRVDVESYLPPEEKSFIPLPPKVVPSEDPNL